MAELMESIELKRLGIKDTTHLLVNTTSENQELFKARQCAVYIFQAHGMVTPTFWLKIKTLFDLQDDIRFAFIDLTEARRRLIHDHERYWKCNTGQILRSAVQLLEGRLLPVELLSMVYWELWRRFTEVIK